MQLLILQNRVSDNKNVSIRYTYLNTDFNTKILIFVFLIGL